MKLELPRPPTVLSLCRDGVVGFGEGGEVRPTQTLLLERCEEALSDGVIVAVAGAA
jgi:hypothetical protein